MLRLPAVVSPAQRSLDGISGWAEHLRSDVERPAVVQETDLDPIVRCGALDRLLLNEIGQRGCETPELLFEPTVQTDGAIRCPYGGRLLAWRHRIVFGTGCRG